MSGTIWAPLVTVRPVLPGACDPVLALSRTGSCTNGQESPARQPEGKIRFDKRRRGTNHAGRLTQRNTKVVMHSVSIPCGNDTSQEKQRRSMRDNESQHLPFLVL